MKLGLKLWSTNTMYWPVLQGLYDQGMFDYIELFSFPGTFESSGSKWRSFKIDYIIHAPHYAFQFNLSQRESEKKNLELYTEARKFADFLSADMIITHCGVGGTLDEVIRQIKLINEPRMVVENKPVWGLQREPCVNTTVEDMERVTKECGLQFCLDIGHAIGSANALKKDPYDYVAAYDELDPLIYHLSDGDIHSEKDAHLHFGKGDYDISRILKLLNQERKLSIETEKNHSLSLEDAKIDHEFIRRMIGQL